MRNSFIVPIIAATIAGLIVLFVEYGLFKPDEIFSLITRLSTMTVQSNKPKLVASFTASPISGPAPLKVEFVDTSTGAINNWAWDFGDSNGGASIEGKTRSHAYSNPGTYTVKLTVRNAHEFDTAIKYISVTPSANRVSELKKMYDQKEN